MNLSTYVYTSTLIKFNSALLQRCLILRKHTPNTWLIFVSNGWLLAVVFPINSSFDAFIILLVHPSCIITRNSQKCDSDWIHKFISLFLMLFLFPVVRNSDKYVIFVYFAIRLFAAKPLLCKAYSSTTVYNNLFFQCIKLKNRYVPLLIRSIHKMTSLLKPLIIHFKIFSLH